MELSGAKKYGRCQFTMDTHIHSNIDRVQYIKTILKLRGLLEINLFSHWPRTGYVLQTSFLTNRASLDYLLTKIETKWIQMTQLS